MSKRRETKKGDPLAGMAATRSFRVRTTSLAYHEARRRSWYCLSTRFGPADVCTIHVLLARIAESVAAQRIPGIRSRRMARRNETRREADHRHRCEHARQD
jgi:hypothetical protein